MNTSQDRGLISQGLGWDDVEHSPELQAVEAIGWHSRDRLRLRLGWSDRLGWGEEDRWLGLVLQRNVPSPLDCLLAGRQRWLI